MVENFKKLDDYQHARLRTEMYMGSREEHTQSVVHFTGASLEQREFTWVPALWTAFRELLDNALDEMVSHGHGDSLRVEYNPETMEFVVEDNGRGIPIDEKAELGKGPAASVLLGEARAGRNFDERKDVAGANGLGGAIVNFVSEWFQLDIWRQGKHFRQKWEEGVYRGKEIHRTSGPTIGRGSKDRTGTRIQFKPSGKVFPKMTLPLEFVQGRMWDIAVINPKLKVYFNGQRITIKHARDPVAATYFEGRPVSLIEITSGNFRSRFYVSPGFSNDRSEVVHSVVNNLPMFEGGSHIKAFSSLFYPAVLSALGPQAKKEGLVVGRSKEVALKKEHVSAGLLIFNVTRMDDPRFDSQTKVRLVTEVKTFIKDGFIESDVKSLIRRNPEWVQAVFERCRMAIGASDQRDLDKAQKEKKGTKIAKLKDATGRDRSKCILFIAEGASAISGMVSTRDPEIHGGIELRGKIMNVHPSQKFKAKDVVDNSTLSDIMLALGLTIGDHAPRRYDLRYGKVYIATDEDEDGKNITALLVNFFYTYWPSLFQDGKNPFIYKFSTPYIILSKGKDRKYIYASDYARFQADLEAGKHAGWTITRAKGLARLDEVDWRHSLEAPELVPIVDDGHLKETLDMIFNEERTDDRKEWLAK